MSLRARLALSTTGLLVVGITVTGLSSTLALRHSLDDRIESTLAQVVEAVENVSPAAPALVETLSPGSLAPTGVYTGLVTSDGRLLPGATPSPASSPPRLDDRDPRTMTSTTTLPGGPGGSGYLARTAVLAAPVDFPVGGGDARGRVEAVLLAIPLDSRDRTLAEHVQRFVAAGTATAVAGLVASWLLTGRTLAPLTEISAWARRVAAGEQVRLRTRPAVEEVRRVAVALDSAVAARWRAEQRMRDFVADASHELRTPLAAVHGWADLYREGGAPTREAGDEVIGHILRETTRMTRLVDGMLVLARLDDQVGGDTDPVAAMPVDLGVLVTDAVSRFAPLHPAHRITARGPERAVVALADPDLLVRALDNLLSNAIVHTPDGTRVTVSADAQGSRARLTVRDDGPGLSPGELDQAGRRFWRASPGRGPGGGSGLGLAIAREAVRACGGGLELSAAPGRGLLATIDLPVAQSEVQEPRSRT
jgi:two-component system OmpR family sensor kinase